MKKKIIIRIIAITFAFIFSLNISISPSGGISTVSLSNIEALAEERVSYQSCWGDGQLYCPLYSGKTFSNILIRE